MKKIIAMHVVIKLLKTRDKEKILEATQEDIHRGEKDKDDSRHLIRKNAN